VGQGPEAATLSALARYTLRAAAELTGDPARAVAHLNAVLRGQPGLPLCTVVCARLEERGGDWTACDVELRRGDVLAFYTDGVLDAVGAGDRFGEARLRAALAGLGGTVEERVAGLAERLEAFRAGERRDDLTVLMLEYGGS